MNTELSFLMDLFLDEELPKGIKVKIKDRIREVEESFKAPQQAIQPAFAPLQSENTVIAKQQPSMQRLMANNPDLIPKPPVPVTPAAAQALAYRQSLMESKGQESGRKAPRKI